MSVESAEICHREVAFTAGETRPWHESDAVQGIANTFLASLVEGMRCGILAIDREARLAMINEPGRQILGLEGEIPAGTPIKHALGQHPQLVRLLCESFSMTHLPNRAELNLNPGCPRGKRIGFTLSMIGGDERPAGVAIFFKDLTQIEHKEEQERLRDRLAALGQMAASLAHEIRNPLASIDVSCSLLQRRLRHDEEARDLLAKIAAEIRRLNRTITSSLEFVRPVATSFACSDLTEVLQEAIDIAQERRVRPGVTVTLEVADSIRPFLMDRQQLRQVFENLVLNAIEAVGSSGRVIIEAETLPAPTAASIPYEPGAEPGSDPWREFERFAVVRVADTGPGIPPGDRDRVFFPFFTTKKQGSGVGLPTVKKVVNSHRGLIDVGDAPQGGALLTVRLPMVLQPAEV